MSWFRHNLRWGVRGAVHVLRTQKSAHIQLVLAALVIAAGFFFKIDRLEWIVVIFAIGCVLAAEAMNTALEALADAVHPERHPLVGRAKDCAAGAVLFTAIAASIAGFIVFVPKILPWLTSSTN